MPYFRIITFGCKVNQCDSAGLAQGFTVQGWQAAPAGVPPDLVLVNTCTVTGRSDQQARQAIRRVAREHTGAAIWVTGCYAQRAPAEVAVLPGVQAVLGNQEKAGLAELLAETPETASPRLCVGAYSSREHFQPWPVQPLPGHTRIWLKVQDGCSHHCSYCIVPQVRGPGRSLEPPAVDAALKEAAALGYQEVVLTGVDLGQYGHDLSPAGSLTSLVRRLKDQVRPFRVRFSSLEPQGITPVLLEECATWQEFCPHFHLPLQSGAAPVLAAMGRPYRPEDFKDLVREIKRYFPDAALGLDILAGFPTERADDFEATLSLVESLPVAYLHVFPFSPRPGTAAAHLPRLAVKEVQARARIMRQLGQLKKHEFQQSQLGKMRDVLVEGPALQGGWLKGLSDNYLRVIFPGPPAWRNRRVMVRFDRRQGEVLLGDALGR
jgi:threonylcarbamoyladenosine tRNA methylthiotransferase MtaB